MGKKILILNGSPRKKGNTAALIDAFSAGAAEAGHEIIRFDLHWMQIHPCIGCCAGGKDPDSPCVQKDDMEKIYAAFREADVLCLASPLYYWSISGQLKCAFDRLFALSECNEDLKAPAIDCTLLMAGVGQGFHETAYWYERLTADLGWTNRGMVLCSNAYHPGDIKGSEKLQEAYRLGHSL